MTWSRSANAWAGWFGTPASSWAEAIRAHKLAPPDEGFAGRLEKLAEAAAAEQLAWQQAHAAGMRWRPVPGADQAEPPYELRAGHRPSRAGGPLAAFRRRRARR